MATKDLWAGIGSALAFLFALITMAMNQSRIKVLINKISAYLNPHIQITIPEYGAESFKRSDFFVAVEAYLSNLCHQPAGVRKLKAELQSGMQKPQVSVDDDQEIIDTFNDATLWWYAGTELPKSTVITLRAGDEKRRFYRVAFHKRFHEHIVDDYLPDVIKKGREFIVKNRQHRLFTNNASSQGSSYGGEKSLWSHVEFRHPAEFDMLAMDPAKKEEIMADLEAFKTGKERYAKVGKAWKRGYLLFGPPGTGKSMMIAAMANFMDYDIYDMELTAVKNNTELRKLFIETKGKSIIVLEDIDCSVDLTGKRRDNKKARSKSGDQSDMVTMLQKEDEKKDDQDRKLTLSGVLNFIDGLWSACGEERIIIFTTNYKDKLDPALIRRGRMDMHIEMSYCRYEAFKVLAHNYLDISEYQFFELFGEIHRLLDQVDMPPADVAEHLIQTEKKDAGACLQGLVRHLKILMGALDPKFTVTFVVTKEEEEDPQRYCDFIGHVRKKVTESCTPATGVDQPVLPLEEKIPKLWFHIVLHTKTSSLTLAIRMDNLYLVGFKTPSGVWWEFGQEGDTHLIGDTAKWLDFGGSYKDLTPKMKLHTNPLGREQLRYAVDSLAAYPTGVIFDDEYPHKTQMDMLARLVIMFCEGLRFHTLSDMVDKKFRGIPATITEMEATHVEYWDKISKAVFMWAVDPKAKIPEMEAIGIKDKNTAAGIIALVKRQTSTGENKDEL